MSRPLPDAARPPPLLLEDSPLVAHEIPSAPLYQKRSSLLKNSSDAGLQARCAL